MDIEKEQRAKIITEGLEEYGHYFKLGEVVYFEEYDGKYYYFIGEEDSCYLDLEDFELIEDGE